MNNTRTLISSSLVSFVIIILGLFMLCMSRAPRISFDEPLVEGGGVESDTVGVDDQDFAALLNNGNTSDDTLTENNATSTVSDDDFLNLLNEEAPNTSPSDQSSSSGDEGMDDILRLLDLNDESSATNNTEPLNTNQQTTPTEFSENSNQTNVTAPSQTGARDKLSEQIDRLEEVLANRTTEAESLQVALNNYDRRINDYETQSSSSKGKKANIQKVSYSEVAPSEKSSRNDNPSYTSSYSSSNFEESYNRGITLFQNQDYPQAIEVFFQLIQQNYHHPLADNCQYWLGECRFAQGKYYQAVAEFNKVFAYDSPDKQDDAQLMIGLAYMKLGELNSARMEFDWLVSCFASSEYANTAHRYLGQF